MNKKLKRGPKRKLSMMEEIAICNMHSSKEPIATIAYTFKVSPSTVTRIIRRHKKMKEEAENNNCG